MHVLSGCKEPCSLLPGRIASRLQANPGWRLTPSGDAPGRARREAPHEASYWHSFIHSYPVLHSISFFCSALPIFHRALPFIAYDMTVRLRQILNHWHVSLMSSSIQFIYSLCVSVSSFPFSVFLHACKALWQFFCILPFVL